MNKNQTVIDLKKAMRTEHPAGYYVVRFLALFLGIFFLCVSAQKLIHPHAFATSVFKGHIMPYPLVNVMALIFMSLEFIAAFVVVFMAKWRRAGLCLLIGLLLIYTGCASFNLLRDLNTVCGCFGSGARAAALSWALVARNLGFVVAGLFALR